VIYRFPSSSSVAESWLPPQVPTEASAGRGSDDEEGRKENPNPISDTFSTGKTTPRVLFSTRLNFTGEWETKDGEKFYNFCFPLFFGVVVGRKKEKEERIVHNMELWNQWDPYGNTRHR